MTTQPAITARADRRLIRPHSRSRRFVLAQVTAPPATRERDRLPVNLAFVLDRSGSMSGEKIELAKRTISAALEHLDERDRFSIVVYDDVVELVVGSTPGSAEARRNAMARLDAIDARGSTNLSEGWFRGAEQVATHLAADGVNRCLVLTDGLANKGLTDAAELAKHAGELRARGVSTTTFGVGTDFDEALLQGMADAGGGHFYFVRDAATIRDHITSEVGETLEIVARDVELEVVAAEDVVVEAISPQPTRPRGSRTVVSLSDLVAEQVIDVVLRIAFPYGEIGRDTGVIIGLTDRDGVFAAGGRAAASDARLSWTYADNAANDAQPRDTDVDRAVANQFAARARQEAVRLNRAGDYAGAHRVLGSTGRRIRAYAGRDAALRGMVKDLESEGDTFAAPMAPMALKEAHFASANMARTRDSLGRSKRRGA
jgi:Ca-activated chloride channel family protein